MVLTVVQPRSVMLPELGEEGMKVTGNEEQGQRLLVAASARGQRLK